MGNIGDLLYFINQEQRAEEMLKTGRCIDCECDLNDDCYCPACGQYKVEEMRPRESWEK